jgi:hypothetical protein
LAVEAANKNNLKYCMSKQKYDMSKTQNVRDIEIIFKTGSDKDVMAFEDLQSIVFSSFQ